MACHLYGGYSSVGRAPDCGSGCRGFEPLYPPHNNGDWEKSQSPVFITVGRSVTVTHQTLTLILWVRVPPSQPRRSGRAPLRSWAPAAPAPTGCVSASPLLLSKSNPCEFDFVSFQNGHAPVAQQAEHLPFKQGVRGSNPRWSTKKTVIIRWLSFLHFQWIRTHGHQICRVE